MGQFKDVSIKNVIEELNQSYFLPDIQREYVWLRKAKEKKIEQLFDSILRGYPIGSFLFWELKKDDIETSKEAKDDSDKLNFQLYRFIENYDERATHNQKVNIEQINSNDLSIVLDGQQRLTSLYIGLKGSRTLRKPKGWRDNPNAYEEKMLYLNLRYHPNEENPEDNYEFDFFRRDSELRADEHHYWFKVGEILEMGSIVAYSRENGLFDKEAEILEKLKDAFCTKNLISYFEETEKNLNKVLKIFIRVNSGGTQLSYSDLLMSILTANFSTDIRDLMNKFVDAVKEEGFSVMGRDQVLKTCLMITGSNHIFQLRNFSKANINKIEENWERLTETIFRAIKLLNGFGYRNNLSSGYILSIVAYYLFVKEEISEQDKVEILSFVRNAQITSYFTTSLDGKLEVVAKILRSSADFQEINYRLAYSKTRPLKINGEDIEGFLDYQYGNPAILPLLQILYPHLDYKNSRFHIDHIYPKSRFNRKNKNLGEDYIGEANFLYNLQLLQGDENIAKRAKDPEIWLNEYFSSNSEHIRAYKRRNYIDESSVLDWQNIEDFDTYRSERIKEKLKQALLPDKKEPHKKIQDVSGPIEQSN